MVVGKLWGRAASACCVALTVLAAQSVSACNLRIGAFDSVSKHDLERQIVDILAQRVGKRPDSVTCDGGVEAEAGATRRCVLTSEGALIGLTVTVTDAADGIGVHIEIDDKPMDLRGGRNK